MHKSILSLTIIGLFFIISCNEENSDKTITGKVNSATECKSFDKNSAETQADESCIEYIYDADEMTLYLTHINAGFNCCPGDITIEISQNGDSIFINEHEQSPKCNCNCLFDIGIELNNIKKDTYHLKFIEPYATNQENLIFSINLDNSYIGSYCVSRTGYPWGIL